MVLVAACGDDDAPIDASTREDAGPCTTDMACDDGVYCNGAEQCEMGACVNSVPPCGMGMTCDEAMETCNGTCDNPDADGDGRASIECGGDDCDDDDDNRFPSNPEVCDAMGHDEDCDPSTLGERDVDLDGHVDAACCNGDVCGLDCADRLPDVFPGASETCNLRDDDCDGTVDEGETVELHRDEDGDLHGTDPTILACAGTARTTTSTLDCNDDSRAVHGAQLEICDGVDNDCDDNSDEHIAPFTWYPDVDDDGFGNPRGTTLIQCDTPVGYSLVPTDCDDTNNALSPIAPELCNARDDDCDGVANLVISEGDTEDDDRDLHPDVGCGGDDCDDLDPYAYFGAPELDDGVDNDCDGVVDEDIEAIAWYADTDSDGTGGDDVIMSDMRQRGRVTRGGDCDDSTATRVTGGRELCDGIDNDCDGTIDEDAVGTRAWYPDGDGDGYGRPTESMLACEAPMGFVESPGDCDDTNEFIAPDALEICDGLDNDCDDVIEEDAAALNWYPDGDDDMYGAGTPVLSCAPVADHALLDGDCVDDDPFINPGADDDDCDGVNEDCDLNTDEAAPVTTYYLDEDMDTYAADDADVPTMDSCMQPVGYTEMRGDCDDEDGDIYPNAPELCDGVSQDCDMAIDEDEAAGFCDPLIVHPDLTGLCVPPPAAPNECACVMSGFGDCDGNPTNGCETDITRNTEHCGGCGNPCSDGEYCNDGVCAPAPIEELLGFGNLTCVRRTGGVVQCWGSDPVLLSPVAYTARTVLSEFDVISIATSRTTDIGGTHTCMVVPSAAGGTDIYCWGRNNVGQCGDGMTTSQVGSPRRIAAAVDDDIEDWEQVLTLREYTLARRANGEVYSWGGASGGSSGQLGRNIAMDNVPGAVVMIDDAVDIAGGFSHACAVRGTNGEVWCWGSDSSDRSGDGPTNGNGFTPEPVVMDMGGPTPITNFENVECHQDGGCALRADSTVWCWGSGALGTGLTSSPYAVQVPGVTGATDIACGVGPYCCAVVAGGFVQCWGSGTSGQLGHNATTNESFPVNVQRESGVSLFGATSISASIATTCAVIGNQVACWGSGAVGQLGDGITATHNVSNAGAPTYVMGL